MDIQLFQHNRQKSIICPQIFFCTGHHIYANFVWPPQSDPLSSLPVLMPVWHYLNTVTSKQVLKSNSATLPISPLFFKVALAPLRHLHSHPNFRISWSVSTASCWKVSSRMSSRAFFVPLPQATPWSWGSTRRTDSAHLSGISVSPCLVARALPNVAPRSPSFVIVSKRGFFCLI